MANQLPPKKGISAPSVTYIPDQWSKPWFRDFITNFLVGGDVRNATSGDGIDVGGTISSPGTVTANIALSPIPTGTILGNLSGSMGPPIPLSDAQITSLIDVFTATSSGAVPASGGGAVNFLRADGTFAIPVSPANPTSLVGPIAVNGTAVTYMRSDSAPGINLSVSYTWSALHTFSAGIVINPPAGVLIATNASLTTGAGTSAGTLTNAPSAGNPTKWIKINDNGTIRSIPAW